jgi:hypothetical protein
MMDIVMPKRSGIDEVKTIVKTDPSAVVDAGAALLAVCSTRRSAGGTMRVEKTLRDAANTYRIGLCYIPKLI